jgi:uncharacterized protein (TIGR02598 family)
MKKLSTAASFSLVELTLALGVAAFCLIAVFGLVPVGVQTNRNATSQTAATNILSSVVSDIRASPPGQSNSKKYSISRSKRSGTTVCFDGQAAPTGAPIYNQNEQACTTSNSRYRLFVKIANNPTSTLPGSPNYVYLKVIWPALASPAITPSGSVEMVATYPIVP